ncbi:MAG TPA: tRNA pseudouridine(38-40) synthase TruA [Bacteroidales bacterium]|nr:tRNA pseudouridine(38-40) synthase TruA [Bacteroidales bacterium]
MKVSSERFDTSFWCKMVSFVFGNNKQQVLETKGRYFVWLSFKGTAYSGWQSQPGTTTVQQILNHAMSVLLRHEVLTIGAGRTDTGVHAKVFAAHFDVPLNEEKLNTSELVSRLNKILPPDIAIDRIVPVSQEAHARFSATHRTYHYLICRRKDPFFTGRAWLMDRPLNIDLMQEAADILPTEVDFQSFTKSNADTRTHLCKVTMAQWHQEGNMLRFEITADRFLRNMVRAIVGTLVDVGLGKMTVEGFKKIIEARDRTKAGYSVPAKGLYLVDIGYPDEIFLPE